MDAGRLLLVDDDEAILGFLRLVLAQGGYETLCARNGAEALVLLAQEPDLDAILLDRQLPDLDGLEVLRRVRADEARAGLPVVLQSSLDRPEDITAGLEAGAFYYLVKPLDPKTVLQVVGAACRDMADKRRLWAEITRTRSAMSLIRRGAFRFQTLTQCHDLAALLARACPDPRRRVIGLSELMINALEHGNLGITYAEKTALLEAGSWEAEVRRRLALPEYRDRHVEVRLTRSEAALRFRIQDMGSGFPWQDYMEPDPDRLLDSHGRGILLARWEAFDRVTYVGCGNCVVAEIDI